MQNEHNAENHVSIVVCGHVDAGKSTTTGHLLTKLGGISQRDLAKLQSEADIMGRSSFVFAFCTDKGKDSRLRGITIDCAAKTFQTERYHYTIIDAPGHRDFIKNMISGASQADAALLLVPADGNFAASICKGSHKSGIVQGQSRQHARLINLLGIKQLIVGINKMDCDMAAYGEARFNEVKDEVKHMLVQIGWKKAFVHRRVPIIPLSGWRGDNLIEASENMSWWCGQDVFIGKKVKIHLHTIIDCLDKYVQLPARDTVRPLRMPVSGVYKIPGIGDVITGRVEQGALVPGDSCRFVPAHSSGKHCVGKVLSIEMHHSRIKAAAPGDNVGCNLRGLPANNMPRVGDVMVKRDDESLQPCKTFTAQVQVLTHPGQLKVGYTPIAYVRTGRAACRIISIDWKVGKETNGAKVPSPVALKANDMAQVVFAPVTPFVVEARSACDGLGRVALMEGNSVVMLGKVMVVEWSD